MGMDIYLVLKQVKGQWGSQTVSVHRTYEGAQRNVDALTVAYGPNAYCTFSVSGPTLLRN